MDRIICPSCLSVFRTIYSEGKQERCPYCGQPVKHTAEWLSLAQRVLKSGATPEQMREWVEARLQMIRTWWLDQPTIDRARLDILIHELEEVLREAETARRSLPESGS